MSAPEGTYNVAPDLHTMLVRVDELECWVKNPRLGDVRSVQRSLNRFGQRTPIVYRSEQINGELHQVVYAGNHRLVAARELEWTHIAAVAADDLSPDEIRGFALADNRTGDLGTYDGGALAELLRLMQDTDMLEDAGYSDHDLDSLLDATDLDTLDDLEEQLGDLTDEDTYDTIKVKAPIEIVDRWNELTKGADDLEVFTRMLGLAEQDQ